MRKLFVHATFAAALLGAALFYASVAPTSNDGPEPACGVFQCDGGSGGGK